MSKKNGQKLNRKLSEKSGMSLIELIVSMAIIVIFGGAIIFFFSTTINNTTKVDTDNTVHMEAQSAWNQLRNDIQNTNAGIYTDGTKLVLYRKTADIDDSTGEQYLDGSGNPVYKKVEKTVYTFDATTNQLWYEYTTADYESGAWSGWSEPEKEVFAGFISNVDAEGNEMPGFQLEITDDEGNVLSKASGIDKTPKSVKVTITYLNDKAKTETVKNVMIRNTLKWVSEVDNTDEAVAVYPADVVN